MLRSRSPCSDSPGPERSRSKSEQLALIGTLAGVVSTLAAVITLLVIDNVPCRLGFESLCSTTPNPPPPIPEPTTTTQGPPDDPDSTTTTRRPLPPTQSAAVRWQGQFLIRKVVGVDLDTLPPSAATGHASNLATGDATGDLFYDNSEALGYQLATLVTVR
jgi:hypothetical protein